MKNNIVDLKDLEILHEKKEILNSIRILDEPTCPSCNSKIVFTKSAGEEISICRITTIPQIMFQCPVCNIKLIIEARGILPVSKIKEGISIGAPSEGFWIGTGAK